MSFWQQFRVATTLVSHCYSCHGAGGTASGYNITSLTIHSYNSLHHVHTACELLTAPVPAISQVFCTQQNSWRLLAVTPSWQIPRASVWSWFWMSWMFYKLRQFRLTQPPRRPSPFWYSQYFMFSSSKTSVGFISTRCTTLRWRIV